MLFDRLFIWQKFCNIIFCRENRRQIQSLLKYGWQKFVLHYWQFRKVCFTHASEGPWSSCFINFTVNLPPCLTVQFHSNLKFCTTFCNQKITRLLYGEQSANKHVQIHSYISALVSETLFCQDFYGFSSYLHKNFGIVPSSRPWLHPCISSPGNHSQAFCKILDSVQIICAVHAGC